MTTPLVTPDEIFTRIAVPYGEPETERVKLLIDDAEEIIQDAFEEVGRSYETELLIPRTRRTIVRVVREMVAAAVVVGPTAGARRLSSASGPQSDSVEWDRVPDISFAGVKLTNEQRRELGLLVGEDFAPSWNFPPAFWPDRGCGC